LAEALHTSERSVERAIKHLEATGWIYIKHRYLDDGRQASNLYTFAWNRAVKIDLTNPKNGGVKSDTPGVSNLSGRGVKSVGVGVSDLADKPIEEEPIEEEPIEEEPIEEEHTHGVRENNKDKDSSKDSIKDLIDDSQYLADPFSPHAPEDHTPKPHAATGHTPPSNAPEDHTPKPHAGGNGQSPAKDTPLQIPYGHKEVATELGARYRAGHAGTRWYAPPGVDLSPFEARGWLLSSTTTAKIHARPQKHFVCDGCGATSAVWVGHCDGCGAWNKLQERPIAEQQKLVASDKHYQTKMGADNDAAQEQRLETIEISEDDLAEILAQHQYQTEGIFE
jgi:hypothetical protein